jgi:proteasome lid subunit RPN8/RPN11
LLFEDTLGDQKYVAVENRARSVREFFMSAADWRRAMEAASIADMRLVAVVHSHARGTDPSAVDLAWRAQSDVPWLIVSIDPDGGMTSRLI